MHGGFLNENASIWKCTKCSRTDLHYIMWLWKEMEIER